MNGWIGLDIYQKKLVDSNGLMDYFDPSISNPSQIHPIHPF
jgi:hypothetical protein